MVSPVLSARHRTSRYAAVTAGALLLGSLAGCADAAPEEGPEGHAAGVPERGAAEGGAAAGGDSSPDDAGNTRDDPIDSHSDRQDPETTAETSHGEARELDDAAALGPGIDPTQLSIPSLDLEAENLVDLGIAEDGTMEVPEDWDAVGWFADGGAPGGRGPTVLAGHVDSTTGPAVFYDLNRLTPGDAVEVTDEEDTVHEYVVDRVEEHAKSDFPTHEVFGASPQDELRLITCGGEFDTAANSHEENLIVFASPRGR